MHFKHFTIGVILFLIGLSILSPFEEIFVLIPLSYSVGHPEIVPVFTAVAALCLALGIFLMGKSALMKYGMIGKTIAHHPMVIIGTIITICIVVYWVIMYG